MSNAVEFTPGAFGDDPWTTAISQMHRAGAAWVVAVTGGGSGGIGRLLAVPGGSASTLEAIVPYSAESLRSFLGRAPEQACSAATALALAATAWRRAGQLLASAPPTAPAGLVPAVTPGKPVPSAGFSSSAPLSGAAAGLASQPSTSSPTPQAAARWPVGVGCTAALVSDRPKRGEHRCHVAVHSAFGTRLVSLTLSKGARTRAEEEQVVADTWLRLLAAEVRVEPPPHPGWLPEDRQESRWQLCDVDLRDLYQGRAPVAWRTPAQQSGDRFDPARVVGILPGSFNPVHVGHQQLRRVAERVLGGPVAWEISVLNVDKPPLDALTLADRCASLGDAPVALTGVARFVDKARILPGRTFVVGADTAERIVSPKYYGEDVAALRQALTSIREQGCRFLVAGRLAGTEFQELSDLSIPPEFADLFQSLPETLFRSDLSSTQIRQAQAGEPGTEG